MRVVCVCLLFLAFTLLIGRAADYELAQAGDSTRVVTIEGTPRKVFSYGLISMGGRGAESWRYEYVKEKRRTKWLQRRLTARVLELRRKWKPTVDYAYRLASATYGVHEWELRSVGGCESNHYPFAVNGQYRGVMQEGPMFERGPYGRSGFSVWDPIANVMTAAQARVADGSWRQWACKP